MPSDQGRRHPQHHLRGFLGIALHKYKSKSSEQLGTEAKQETLHKRVLSSRDLSSSGGFANVLAELTQAPMFSKEDSTSTFGQPKEKPENSKPHKNFDTVPFSVKYSVAKDTAKKPNMSVAVIPSSTLVTQANGDPDKLDQALQNIRIKLVSIVSIDL